jgi:hypothetical protein
VSAVATTLTCGRLRLDDDDFDEDNDDYHFLFTLFYRFVHFSHKPLPPPMAGTKASRALCPI